MLLALGWLGWTGLIVLGLCALPYAIPLAGWILDTTLDITISLWRTYDSLVPSVKKVVGAILLMAFIFGLIFLGAYLLP